MTTAHPAPMYHHMDMRPNLNTVHLQACYEVAVSRHQIRAMRARPLIRIGCKLHGTCLPLRLNQLRAGATIPRRRRMSLNTKATRSTSCATIRADLHSSTSRAQISYATPAPRRHLTDLHVRLWTSGSRNLWRMGLRRHFE
jgi:hypothetical protein